MAVARHAVNRTGAKSGDSVVVFGAGPIGLGATIGYKLSGARSVVVADVVPSRLEKALAVGADAVINSAEEDVVDQLTKLHGSAATAIGKPRPGTDINLDAAGVPVVIDTALSAAKQGATLGVVALHKKPVSVDFGAIATGGGDRIRLALCRAGFIRPRWLFYDRVRMNSHLQAYEGQTSTL